MNITPIKLDDKSEITKQLKKSKQQQQKKKERKEKMSQTFGKSWKSDEWIMWGDYTSTTIKLRNQNQRRKKQNRKPRNLARPDRRKHNLERIHVK